jgi:nucleoside 2-deoxyribosyltransferase
MILYLAGPMKDIPDKNKAAFRKAQALLENEGHTVISPLDLEFTKDDGTFDFPRSFLADLEAVCMKAEGLVALPGWQDSEGACVEMACAKRLGKPVWVLDVFLVHGEEGPTV